jgi:hypothetical protein
MASVELCRMLEMMCRHAGIGIYKFDKDERFLEFHHLHLWRKMRPVRNVQQ